MTAQKFEELSEFDRALVAALQDGLPLVSEPYAKVANQLGVGEELVLERVAAMLETGAIRRIAAVPNHRALGMRANGMSVWDIVDEDVERIGKLMGALDFVSHCYQRPRWLPTWPYNVFAMVHGKTRSECVTLVKEIEALVGPSCKQHDVLFSTKTLKKTGLRLRRKGENPRVSSDPLSESDRGSVSTTTSP
ncbi:Lrp/AsnC family transcriptional regulator [Pseudovibrio sp. Tun.PSC04-5.I4]|uniref:siroheme decarboxylase subunit beta n=1 Tax=Pseudovibrio sp. Tun.PSC04-5.I4 TaxID=1798213 RepID=UPI00087FAA52|nr:Lrp/AsnC family transcriptional regulator [Pseudovibrio sp. Tun.PSC04-5.I4]SDR48494.1 DNA-binding transcriptional regulator, Lrp family [Pseudovibrio sp. Tun.PSC04-5.I4]